MTGGVSIRVSGNTDDAYVIEVGRRMWSIIRVLSTRMGHLILISGVFYDNCGALGAKSTPESLRGGTLEQRFMTEISINRKNSTPNIFRPSSAPSITLYSVWGRIQKPQRKLFSNNS